MNSKKLDFLGNPSHSFDKGFDFNDIKTKLIDRFDSLLSKDTIKINDLKHLAYLTISLIQLRNGSRISEAIEAFKLFMNNPNHLFVSVKIAKSETNKYNPHNGTYKLTKIRHRKILFPHKWIDVDIIHVFLALSDPLSKFFNRDTLHIEQSTCHFLSKYFNGCNTHSLRYAFINHLLYVEKRPITDVAKFVGHADVSQLVRYTQIKNSDQIFDLDL